MKEPKQRKPHLKQPMNRSISWIKKNKAFLIAGAVIIAMFIAAIFISIHYSNQAANERARQAELRLNELKDEQEQEKIGWETAKQIEIDKAIEEARAKAQAEMAEQMAVLNQRLDEENKAYEDLLKSFDDLKATYEQLMETVFGPGWNNQSYMPIMYEPVIAMAVAAEDVNDLSYFFPKGLDPHIDIYLGWREKYPEGYANLMKWGKAFSMGDEANYPPLLLDPAMREACFIAYDGARWDAALDMFNRRGSPYYSKGRDIVRYLRKRNRDWYSALTIMEFESTCGIAGGSNDMGILDGRFQPGNIYNYCDYLDWWQTNTFGYTSNELPKIMMVYNDHESYRSNFYEMATNLKNWYP